MHGGNRLADVLRARGVECLFTLCGGHISPILKGAKDLGIRIVDVRHEATAVFAADAVARLSGVPGVAAVTAGPGATNTITAIKNAQMAQSPVIVLGGAAATALKGRGSLQDIDQLALFRPHVKWARSVARVRDLAALLSRAFDQACSGVPGPVFLECPVDLLYEEPLVREWYGGKSGGGKSVSERAVNWYLRRHVNRLFAGADDASPVAPDTRPADSEAPLPDLERAVAALAGAQRPVAIIGSQALLDARAVATLAAAVERLGIPVYLSGMARGLLGAKHPLHMRHKRRLALKEADVALLAGVPCDFRLDYGRQIRRGTFLISANRSKADLKLNRRPSLALNADPGRVLRALAERVGNGDGARVEWLERLRERDAERERAIAAQADATPDALLNPVRLCKDVNDTLSDDSVIVADGGDFVGTASYIVRPRGPLRWLDPGPFGTLGVGAGFAIGASVCRPEAEIWALFGDGSVGYSLSEFDTFVRHGFPVIAVVGNDACWSQIAREQIKILGDDVGTVLGRTDYHRVVEGFGARGLMLDDPAATAQVLSQARDAARDGQPVLVNALLAKTDFREGSLSM